MDYGSGGVHNPFLLGLFPSEERLIPTHNTTKDSWVIGNATQGNNTFFDSQWIQCSYQISGGYGHTPRYIYYILILFAMLMRHTNWLAKAAMASVMVYSGSAAIHALVLAVIREKMAPNSMLENYEVVRVEGLSIWGNVSYYWDDNTEQWIPPPPDDSLWLPVLPMAWDTDVDATLAIVGTAFLVLLPMQTWSTTLRDSGVKIIIWLWGALLLMGLISALIAEQYANFWYFDQLRFCPHGANDSLPLMNDGTQTVGGKWDGHDWYHWNRTIERQFMSETSTEALSNICIYPCFDSRWPIRDDTEIMVTEGNYNPMFDSNTFYTLLIVCYSLVISTGLSSLTIAILTSLPKRWTIRGIHPDSKLRGVEDSKQRRLEDSKLQLTTLMTQQLQWIKDCWNHDRILQLFLSIYFLIIYFYTLVISVPVVFFFVGFMEWTIWSSDPGGETFRHVGQWSTIVASVLVFIAAVISHISKRLDSTADSKADPTALELTQQPPLRS